MESKAGYLKKNKAFIFIALIVVKMDNMLIDDTLKRKSCKPQQMVHFTGPVDIRILP